MKWIEQKPVYPNEWLYEDKTNGERKFYTAIRRLSTSMPLLECTNKEKILWQKEHHPEWFEYEEEPIIE